MTENIDKIIWINKPGNDLQPLNGVISEVIKLSLIEYNKKLLRDLLNFKWNEKNTYYVLNK